MPRKNKIDLNKVMASLNTVCPKCGCSIPPAEVARVDERIECPQCFARFVPGMKQERCARCDHPKSDHPKIGPCTKEIGNRTFQEGAGYLKQGEVCNCPGYCPPKQQN